ncbi:GNAT family N-acetyltransferase [Flammeovirga sp. SJP92]|uniref:GNAT family N-acetyltransferase n=1 Tax=Flammeovirga sp. SJP92 TaxID=1775430 RepID=UPI000788BC03|nr:GNAT family N-acetyltransferase [Flammeovirga sp. SJP92]KXX71957.1 acetyltransferase [Flammeovirga sp. SJP92]
MKVRKANFTDFDQLAALFDAYRVFYKQESDLEGAKQFLQDRTERGESTIYVVEDDGQLVGFVQLYPIFSSTRMKRLWLLNDLFVSPSHRGKGASKLLMGEAKNLAKMSEAAGLILETEKTNTVGNQLYPAVDFKLDTEHNFYYWDVE